MIRAVYKTVTWYSPNSDDMKICAACRDGWAFYYNESLKLYIHAPNSRTPVIICRAVNDLKKIGYRTRLLAKVA